MTDLCIVKKVKNKLVYVELKRGEKCEGCKICAFNRRESIVVPAVSEVDVKPGDTVMAEMPTVSVGVGSLLIYAIPLLLTVVGALIGLVGGLWLQVGLSAGGLVLGVLAAWLIDRAYRKRDGVLPRIIGLYRGDQAQTALEDNKEEQQGD